MTDIHAWAYMKAKDAASFPYMFKPVRAPQIFVSDRKNRLNVAFAMLYAIFTSIHQKFDWCRMDIICRSWA